MSGDVASSDPHLETRFKRHGLGAFEDCSQPNDDHVPVGNALEVGRCKWMTSLGSTEARDRLRVLQTQLTQLSLTYLTKLRRAQVESLLNHVVHLVGIAESSDLCASESPDDFVWQRQLRIYRVRSQGYTLKMGGAVLKGGAELHETHTRAVVSPATAKLWLHLVQGISLKYSPVTCKSAFAKAALQDVSALGARCVPILQCHPGVRSTELSMFFVGVAAAGQWGLLSDVDSLEPAVAASVSVLVEALHASRHNLTLGGNVTPMKAGAAVLATAKGTTHANIPAELLSQFRVVALPPQDLEVVGRTLFTVAGFTETTGIAAKMAVVMKSVQYLLGGEGLLILLLRTIAQKAATLLRRSSQQDRSGVAQELLVVKSAKEVLEAFCPPEAAKALQQHFADVFPGQQSCVHHLRIKETTNRHIAKEGLIAHPPWVRCVTHLYELHSATNSLVLVGPAFSGKTQALQTLRGVLATVCCEAQPEKRLFPKSYSAASFWGSTDALGVWREGVLAGALRSLAGSKENAWLVLDGPFDFAASLESMTDSPVAVFRGAPAQTPILVNNALKLCVETTSIADADPGVMCRTAHVCFDSESVLPWKVHVERWVKTCDASIRNLVGEFARLFNKVFPAVAAFVDKYTEHLVSQAHAVTSVLDTVECFIKGDGVTDVIALRYFWWCMNWVYAARLPESLRAQFHRQFVEQHVEQLPDGAATLWDVCIGKSGLFQSISEHDFGTDWAVTNKASRNEQRLATVLPHLGGAMLLLLQKLNAFGCNIFVSGVHGSGKTTLVEHYLSTVERPHRRMPYRFSMTRAELLDTTSQGTTLFVDDVHVDHRPVDTTGAHCVPLYEVLTRPSTRGVIMTGGDTQSATGGSTSLVSRMLSRFICISCCVSKDSVGVAFNGILSALWPERDFKTVKKLAQVTYAALFNICADAPKLDPMKVNAKLMKDIMWSLAAIPTDVPWERLLSVWRSEICQHVAPIVGDPEIAVVAEDAANKALFTSGLGITPDKGTFRHYTLLDGKNFVSVIADNLAEYSEALQQHCGNKSLLYPSLIEAGARLGNVLQQMGRHAIIRGASGSGRTVIAGTVARQLKMAVAENFRLSATRGAGLKVRKKDAKTPYQTVLLAAAQGQHSVMLLPHRYTQDPDLLHHVYNLLEGEPSAVEGPEAMKTFMEEVAANSAKAADTGRCLLRDISSPEVLAKRMISKFLHIVVCTELHPDELAHTFTSAFVHIDVPKEMSEADIHEMTANGLKDTPAAELSKQISGVLHDAHTWAMQREGQERRKVAPVQSLAAQVLLQFKKVFVKHEEHSKAHASISVKQQTALLKVSTIICENTGIPPRPHVKEQKYSYFMSKHDGVVVRFVLFAERDENTVTHVDSVGFFTDLGNAPDLVTQGTAEFEFDQEHQRLIIRGTTVVDAIFDNSTGEWRLVGKATNTLEDDKVSFEACELPLSGESSQSWLRGDMRIGTRVEPQEIIDDPPTEGLDSLTKRTHEAVELERTRIFKRLAELSLDTMAGDAFVACAIMLYGTYLNNAARIALRRHVFDSAEKHGLPFKKAATRLGLYAVWLGVDETDVAGMCEAALEHGLPPGHSWSDTHMALSRAQSILHDAGTVRFPFVYDPHGVTAKYILASESASREGIGEVICISAGDPGLSGVLTDAVKRGKSLIVERIAPCHWETIKELLTLHLDVQKGRVHCDIGEFGDNSAYSDRFKIFLLSDPNVQEVLPEYQTHCTFVDCTVSGDAVREQLSEAISAGGDYSSDTRKLLAELDLSEQRLHGAEQHLETQSWDVNWSNAIEWYYNPTVYEALASLQTISTKVASLRQKLDSLLASNEAAQEEHKALLSRIMVMYDSSVATAAISNRPLGVVSPWRLKDILAHSLQSSKALAGARGRQEMQELVLAGVMAALLRGMHHEDRVVLTAMVAINQDMAAAGTTMAHVQSFVNGARVASLEDHLAYEAACTAEVDASFASDMKIYHEKVSEQHRRRLEDEAEEAAEKKRTAPAGQKTRQPKAKKPVGEVLQLPTKTALPMNCKPSYSWLSQHTWVNLLQLSSVECFSKLASLIHPDSKEKAGKATREQRWQEFFVSLGKVPEFDKAPVSKFERLLLCLAARPDRAMLTLRKYFTEVGKFNDPYAGVDALNAEVVQQTRPHIPLTFILTGLDSNTEALQMVMTYTQGKKAQLIAENCITVQKGAESAVLSAVQSAITAGEWVFLANMHCASAKLLMDITLCLADVPVDTPFRLVMTYMEVAGCHAPAMVTDSVRVSLSGCRGVRNAMAVLYRSVEEKTLEALCTHEWKRLLFAVLLVVVILHERREMIATLRGGGNTPDSWIVTATAAVATLLSHLSRLRMSEKHQDAHIAGPTWHAFRQALTEVLSSHTNGEEEEVIKAFVDWWIHPEVVQPGMKICKGLSIPAEADTLANHWQLIDAMPATDCTELFGLHPVFETESQQRQLDCIRSAISTALLPLPTEASPLQTLAAKLPPVFSNEVYFFFFKIFKKNIKKTKKQDFQSIAPGAEDGKLHSSFLACLLSEMTALNALLLTVQNDLQSGVCLRDVVDGHIPKTWLGWFDSRTLGAWLTALKRGQMQLRLWVNKKRLPRPFNLGAVQHPKAVLDALIRETARMRKVALSDVVLKASVEGSRRSPQLGYHQFSHEPIILSGLSTTGCRYETEGGIITDCSCKNNQWAGEEVLRFPVLKVSPEVGGVSTSGRLADPVVASAAVVPKAPVSATPEEGGDQGEQALPTSPRVKLPIQAVTLPLKASVESGSAETLLEVTLQSREEPNHWIMRGVAIICRYV